MKIIHQSNIIYRINITLGAGLLLAASVSLLWFFPPGPPAAQVHKDGMERKVVGPKEDPFFGNLPLIFESNQGQFNEAVKFLSRGRGYKVYLTPSGASFAVNKKLPLDFEPTQKGSRNKKTGGGKEGVAFRMNFINSNPAVRVLGRGLMEVKTSYFIGSSPKEWRSSIPNYREVLYGGLYPGVDLRFYENSGGLEYDFIVGPKANIENITLRFEGAGSPRIDADGSLEFETIAGKVRQPKPFIYQEINGVETPVAGGFLIKNDNNIGFKVAAYNPQYTLIIDPKIEFSTYLGWGDFDSAHSVAVDDKGSAYVAGETGQFGFLAKYAPSGNYLEYLNVFGGGSGFSKAVAVALDNFGAAYIIGSTGASDFPTTENAFQPVCGDVWGKAFAMKLSPSGDDLVYSTYFCGGPKSGVGSSTTLVNDVAVDNDGNAYITGKTNSAYFPVTEGSFQTEIGLGDDAFILKLNADGSDLTYSTFLGGSGAEQGRGIALDADGNAYVSGSIDSSYGVDPNDFPTTPEAFQPNCAHPACKHAFITKINPTGSDLIYSTFLGGTGSYSRAQAIAVDASGSAYVTGGTQDLDFPTVNPIQLADGKTATNGVFVSKLTPDGSDLIYSTYLGAYSYDSGYGIAVDPLGYAYVAGFTYSNGFPILNAIQNESGGNYDVFVSKIHPDGGSLVYSTYLGGGYRDEAHGVALDPEFNLYVVGYSTSTDFPTFNAIQPDRWGDYPGSDAFVAKISDSPGADISIQKTPSAEPVISGSELTYTITVTNNGPDTARNLVFTNSLPPNRISSYSGLFNCGAGVGWYIFTCDMDDLESGASSTATISTPTFGEYTLSTTSKVVSRADSDPDFTNNSAMIVSTIRPGIADLQISIAIPEDRGNEGYALAIPLRIKNLGPEEARAVDLYFQIPWDWEFESMSGESVTCTGTASFQCEIDVIDAGSELQINFLVIPWGLGESRLFGSLSGNFSDPNTSNNFSERFITVIEDPPLITDGGGGGGGGGSGNRFGCSFTKFETAPSGRSLASRIIPVFGILLIWFARRNRQSAGRPGRPASEQVDPRTNISLELKK